MKKLVCCFFVAVIAVITAGAQELLVQENSFCAVPGEGQSEVIINFIGTQSILVSINGKIAMQLLPGEITKVVVNNGRFSIRAETYYFTPKTGWANWGRPALFEIDTFTQNIIIRVSNRANGNITITQMNAKPLKTQGSDAQDPNVYSDSDIEYDVYY
jgi:hypothetical protein